MGDVDDPTTGLRGPVKSACRWVFLGHKIGSCTTAPILAKLRLGSYRDAVQCRSLGVGPRLKKIAFISIKVYSITLYVDQAGAKADLQRAQQAGQLESDEGVCSTLIQGPYTKVFQLQLVRSVTGAQFSEAFDESLGPRMKGDTAALESLKAVFSSKHLDNGTDVVLMWRQPGNLEVLTCPPGAPREDFSKAQPEATINSLKLCQALWENYLDSSTPAPQARQRWIEGARALLPSRCSSA